MTELEFFYRHIYIDLRKLILESNFIGIFYKSLRKALKAGFPIDFYFVPETRYSFELYSTLLNMALVQQKQGISLKLLELGADVNVKDSEGRNALLACAYGQSDIILHITEMTSDINAQMGGSTALGILCGRYCNDIEDRNNLLPCINQLIKKGADPCLDTKWESIALYNTGVRKRRDKLLKYITNYVLQREAIQKSASADYEYEI